MTDHRPHDDRTDELTASSAEGTGRATARRYHGNAAETYTNQRTLTGIAVATMVVVGFGLVAAALVAPSTQAANALPTPVTLMVEDATTLPVAGEVAGDTGGHAAPVSASTQASHTETPSDTAPATIAPVQATVAPPTPTPSPIRPVAEVRTGPAQEPLLFWQWGYIGHWTGQGFQYTSSDDPGPDWLVGSTVELRNAAGSIHVATVVECNGQLALSPAPPYANGFEAYWYTAGAPFTFTETDDDSTLTAMDDALAKRGLDPAKAVSYGAPVAADGTADRLVFYQGDGERVWWIATFDAATSTFHTVEGDPGSDPGYEMGIPPAVWTDLDQDGNLESVMFGGDTSFAMEWSSGSSIWDAGKPIC